MNTETSISSLSTMFSSDASYRNLMDMISDLDLELVDVCLS